MGCRKDRARLTGFCLLAVLSVGAVHGDSLIEELGSQTLEARESASGQLVEACLVRRDEVITSLLEAEKNKDPEIARRAEATLRRVFLRLEKGLGAPESGLTIKSKLVTLGKKLATRPLIDSIGKGTMAEKSGLQKGDLILSVNGVSFEGEDGTGELRTLLSQQAAGAKLAIKYSRKIEGERKELETVLMMGESKKSPVDPKEHQDEFDLWKWNEIDRRQR